ncbi:MAG TPA: MarR family transcriptional regulator [Steroidobacteraceae bacterium]
MNAVSRADIQMNPDHHESLRLWLRLLGCSNFIKNHVRRALAKQFKMTLPRFDLMAQIERAPHGIKMGELSRRMLVTGGNVTGIVDQLERAGLIVRAEDPADRRAYLVKLTKAGRQLFTQMASEHETWIVELFSGMSMREQRALNATLLGLRAQLARKT